MLCFILFAIGCGKEDSDVKETESVVAQSDIAETSVQERTIEDVLKDVEPTTVRLYHEKPSGGYIAGSGFIMEMTDSCLYLCTNRHVVSEYEDWTVYFYNGTEAQGKLVGVSNSYDVGVVAVDCAEISKSLLETLAEADIDLIAWNQIGNEEVTIGLVRVGRKNELENIITGVMLRKQIQFLWGNGELETEIRMDIQDGDSGSGIFDENGRLLGMVFGISEDAGGKRYWAVPLDAVVQSYEDITGEK